MNAIGPSLTAIHEICLETNSALCLYTPGGKMMFVNNEWKTEEKNFSVFPSGLHPHEWKTLIEKPVAITQLKLQKRDTTTSASMIQLYFMLRFRDGEPFCLCRMRHNAATLTILKKILVYVQKKIGIQCHLQWKNEEHISLL